MLHKFQFSVGTVDQCCQSEFMKVTSLAEIPKILTQNLEPQFKSSQISQLIQRLHFWNWNGNKNFYEIEVL